MMEGARDVGALLFTRRFLLVQQNADNSLSCHQNNTNSKTDGSNLSVPDIGEFYADQQQTTTGNTNRTTELFSG